MVLFTILAVVFAISVIALIGGVLLLYKKTWAKHLSNYLINFAIGSMFAVVFFDLLPEAVQLQSVGNVFIYTLFGIIFFYLGEKTLLWYHHHSLEHVLKNTGRHPIEERVHPVGYLIVVGDAIHNFLDGVIIAASFLVNSKLGLVTSLAVLFHELPQEIGDFAIMLHAKFSRAKVFTYNLLSQLTAVIGALVGFLYLPYIEGFKAIAISFAAGGFLYIASTDLLPETHKEQHFGKSLLQFVLLILGILVIWYLGRILPA